MQYAQYEVGVGLKFSTWKSFRTSVTLPLLLPWPVQNHFWQSQLSLPLHYHWWQSHYHAWPFMAGDLPESPDGVSGRWEMLRSCNQIVRLLSWYKPEQWIWLNLISTQTHFHPGIQYGVCQQVVTCEKGQCRVPSSPPPLDGGQALRTGSHVIAWKFQLKDYPGQDHIPPKSTISISIAAKAEDK